VVVRTVMLLGLFDVFEEGPVIEAAALGALAARLGHNVVPVHVVARSRPSRRLPRTLPLLAGSWSWWRTSAGIC